MLYRAIGLSCGALIIAIAILWLMIENRSAEVRQLQQLVAAGNSEVPKMINEFTRLDHLSYSPNTVIFHFTVLAPGSDIDVVALRERELSWFTEVACVDELTSREILDLGYAVLRDYQDVDGHGLLQLELSLDDCK